MLVKVSKNQLRGTVRFADGVWTLIGSRDLSGKGIVFIEAGPGRALSTFVGEIAKEETTLCLQSLPGPGGSRTDTEETVNALGHLGAMGGDLDWESFHRAESRSRVSLPSYPFDWFYRPVWRETPLGGCALPALAGRRILVLDRPRRRAGRSPRVSDNSAAMSSRRGSEMHSPV